MARQLASETERREESGQLRATHERLRRQNEALVGLARQGVVGGTDLGSAARAVTESAARTLGAGRASVWMYDAGRTLIRCVDLFEGGGEGGRHSAGAELRRAEFPGYFAAMDQEETIVAADARADARTREFAGPYLEPLGIGAMLDTPIRVGGRTVGVLCVEHVGGARAWEVDEQTFAASLTNLFAVAVEAADRQRSDERYRLVNRVTNDVVWDWDLPTGAVAWGEAMRTMLGVSADEVTPDIAFWAERVHPEDVGRVWQSMRVVIEGEGGVWSDEYRIRRGDGTYAVVYDRAYVAGREPATGRAVRMVGAMQDVTERRRAEEALRFQTALLRSQTEASIDGILAVSREGRVVSYNRRFAEIWGIEEGVLATGSDDALLAAVRGKLADPAEFMARVSELMARPEELARDLVELADGRALDRYSAPLRGADGTTYGRVWYFRDVTEQRRAEKRLREQKVTSEAQARTDGLTDLANRAGFYEELGRAVKRARSEAGRRLAVLHLDLDRFKVINDSLGHEAGDELLTVIAGRLERTVSRAAFGLVGSMMVGRLGGDEFAVLLDGLPAGQDGEAFAVGVARRVAGVVAEPVELGYGRELLVTTSVGVALADGRCESAAQVIRDADAAMYRAKGTGRNRVAVFDEAMHRSAVERLRLEQDLRGAVGRGELVLHYQPIVSLEARRVVGFEALLRWERGGQLVGPAEFVPVAEETGLIVAIGRWVIGRACRQLAEWRRRLGAAAEGVSVSVNLSRRQLGDPELVGHVERVLRETGLEPSWLKLEITESTMMEDARAADSVLRQLKALGVGLEMDDFGTGHSSLACLHQFPIDALKIDRSFVRHSAGRRDYAAVLKAIVDLAHNLGVRVVAEGLETAEDVALLQALECDLGQGYYFAKPAPAQEAERLLLAGEGCGVRAA